MNSNQLTNVHFLSDELKQEQNTRNENFNSDKRNVSEEFASAIIYIVSKPKFLSDLTGYFLKYFLHKWLYF